MKTVYALAVSLCLTACGKPLATAAPAPLPAASTPAAARTTEALEASPAPLPSLPPDRPAPLTFVGMVSVPTAMTGLANAHDGLVAGTPVSVIDVATGKLIGHGNTYYDGSYEAEVPAAIGRRPLIVEVDLVDATTHAVTMPLLATTLATPDLGRATLDVSPESTAWVALLTRLAARQAGQPAPDWAVLSPGRTALELAGLVAGSQATAASGFATFAALQPSLTSAASGPGLKGAIDQLVTGLTAKAN